MLRDQCTARNEAYAEASGRFHPRASVHPRGLRQFRRRGAACRGRWRPQPADRVRVGGLRSEEHTSELQSLMRISYAVFCLKKKTTNIVTQYTKTQLTTHYHQHTTQSSNIQN